VTVLAAPPPPVAARDLVADDLERQLAHWLAAAAAFADAEAFASVEAWAAVEARVGSPLRRQLGDTVDRLLAQGRAARATVATARRDPARRAEAHLAVQRFRRSYRQVETTLEFFGNAVNSRTSPPLRATLNHLDRLAGDSIKPSLDAAGKPVPQVLCYVDQGLGASILRAGVRLWEPGTVNPVAAIKVVRHNLYRPTSLFHETGHQVAHLTGWVPSVRSSLARALEGDPQLATMWTPWASEIAADVFAWLHTGYASISALYDVVGDSRTILRWPLGDPHPIGWLRTMLGCAFCRHAWGSGPWDSLQESVLATHPARRAGPVVEELVRRSMTAMPRIAAACIGAPVPGLAGRPMTAVHDPARVSPAALAQLERTAAAALWTSPHWRTTEGIRIVALAGLREAEDPAAASQWIDRARAWLSGSSPPPPIPATIRVPTSVPPIAQRSPS